MPQPRGKTNPITRVPLSNAENGPKEKPGRTAFDKLMRQIETAADLPIPLNAPVVRVTRIERLAGSAPTRPLLDQPEWAGRKNICAGA